LGFDALAQCNFAIAHPIPNYYEVCSGI